MYNYMCFTSFLSILQQRRMSTPALGPSTSTSGSEPKSSMSSSPPSSTMSMSSMQASLEKVNAALPMPVTYVYYAGLPISYV